MKPLFLITSYFPGVVFLFLTSCAVNIGVARPSATPAFRNSANQLDHQSVASKTTVTDSRASSSKPASSTSEPSEFSDQLSESQKASLRKLGIPVVAPAYVPDEFRVSQVVANACLKGGSARGLCREGSNYTVIYRNPQNTCLLVHAVGGGVGGGAAEFEFQTQTSLLGEVTILFGNHFGASQSPTPEQLRTPQSHLYSFPATIQSNKTPYYSVVVGESAYYQETYGCGRNTSVTPLELEKIVQSLALIE